MRTVNVRTEGDDMVSYTSIFIGNDDCIRSEHRDGSQHPAMLLVKPSHGIGDLSIFADRPVLERLHNVIGAYLAAHPAEAAPPEPAEAATGVTVDVDELIAGMDESLRVSDEMDALLAGMAVSYDVRRGSWDGEGVAG
jgi:hypothetical protein